MRSEGTIAAGIGRSLRLYHGDRARLDRMIAFYGRFLGPGTLAFDIGAHVGDRTRVFRTLGARVIAVEPQPGAARALRLIHGRDAGVTLIHAAAGAQPGVASLRLNRANPTVSTLSDAFVDAAHGADGWHGQVWDGLVDVPVRTLDSLIAAHGRPDFIKIDVEGLEDQVLDGLTQPVPALSFEMTTIQRAVALRALRRTAKLGRYRYALALGERFHLDSPWETEGDMARRLQDLPQEANSGDVYARLESG
ncbi:MAG: FkbM family methyltransferase [Pseudomonadota bacterium]